MNDLFGTNVKLNDGMLLRHADVNREYLMSLDRNHLLLNYRQEAGRYSASYLPEDIHGGWESPTCQLRGHFTGHWLSAAALHYHAAGDTEIKARADYIVDELAACQKDNGGEWAASIPEKYLRWIAKGKAVWAPQYTIHKTFMGLLDMAQYAGSAKALNVAEAFAAWFTRWADGFTREEFDNILDVETGGMLEVWVQLYELTGKEEYTKLIEKYYRGRLFDALLEGRDALTNMHANTTIPEAIGCARAYDLTGEKRWRDIAEAYWDMAVTKRGQYATGGQTCGEIWTPMMNLASRLGDKNQEFCVVYNMMRLAEFLYRWTGDSSYADYRELNIYNGVMTQTYKPGYKPGGKQNGALTYFLPFRPGSKKDWASDKHSFFCCHGTAVQANAALNKGIYYQDGNALYVCQYFDSDVRFNVGGQDASLKQRRDTLAGSFHMGSDSDGKQTVTGKTAFYASHPDKHCVKFTFNCERPVYMKLSLRIPHWVKNDIELFLNGEAVRYEKRGGFAVTEREWRNGDMLNVFFTKGIEICPLPGSDDLAAFRYGPVTLAGLCDTEREVNAALLHDNEREWGSWKNTFKTTGGGETVRFVPLYEIGDEQYTVYFKIKQ
jgi:DUF1680 family protein